jgi:hypothetical protein
MGYTLVMVCHSRAYLANVDPDQTAHTGDPVSLDGGSTGVDGNALTYQQSFLTRPPGSTAVIADPTAVLITFVLDTPGTYVIQLIVNDGAVDSEPGTIIVIAFNTKPVADAGQGGRSWGEEE